MNLVWFCLLAGAIPAWSETRGAPFAPITLYTQFQQAPPDGVMRALRAEVESIMAPIGLHFEWRDLGKTSGHEVSSELAVATFKGRCDTAVLVPRSRFEGALGWTPAGAKAAPATPAATGHAPTPAVAVTEAPSAPAASLPAGSPASDATPVGRADNGSQSSSPSPVIAGLLIVFLVGGAGAVLVRLWMVRRR